MKVFPKTKRLQCNFYLDSLRVRSFSEATIKSHAFALARFFQKNRVEEEKDLRTVTREEVRDYAEKLFASRKFKVSTIRIYLTALKKFFAWLEETDAILINPCRDLVLPKEIERPLPKRVLSSKETQKILKIPDANTLTGKRNRALLELFYSTGIRLEEMQRLSVHDLDLNNGLVRVNCGKGNKGRMVPMGEAAIAALKAYLPARLELLRLSEQITDALWLSLNHPYQPIKKEAIGCMLRTQAQRAGLRRAVGPHLWRHTCATHLLKEGSNIVYVQKLLGHRRLDTTQIYTRVNVRDLKKTHRLAHPRNRKRQR